MGGTAEIGKGRVDPDRGSWGCFFFFFSFLSLRRPPAASRWGGMALSFQGSSPCCEGDREVRVSAKFHRGMDLDIEWRWRRVLCIILGARNGGLKGECILGGGSTKVQCHLYVFGFMARYRFG